MPLVWSFADIGQLVQKLIWRQTRRRQAEFISLQLFLLREKGKVPHWRACADPVRGPRYISNSFATSMLEGVGGQYHAPVVLQPWRTRHFLYGWLNGRRCQSGQVRKNTLSPGFDGRMIQSVACHYTDMRGKNPCNENQLDALLFIHCYFVNQPLHVSGISVAHHQEAYCIYEYTTNLYVLCFSVDCLLATRQSTEKHNTSQLLYIYTVYLLMMGYRYARRM